MANEFKVRKGLVVNGSGSVILDVQGSQGQLFSVTDQLSGSLFSVNDISGVPVLEAFSDSTVKIGQYLAEAIIVSGSTARITGSMSLAGFSTGSVLFAGTGGAISQNNSNFFWDNTNGRLGIGTNAPLDFNLVVQGAMQVRSIASAFQGIRIDSTSIRVRHSSTFSLGTNDSAIAISMFAPTNNVGINTTSDSGERLQVSGSSRFIGNMVITGSDNTSATTALTVQNSTSVNILRVLNDGQTILRGTTNNDTTNIFRIEQQNGNGRFLVNANGQTIIAGDAFASSETFVTISRGNFNPTSGTATHTSLAITPTINQTGGANGITRGIYINPTLTSAWDYRSIEWTNNASAVSGSWGLYGAGSAPNYLGGILGIGTTTPVYTLDVNGTISSQTFITTNANIDKISVSIPSGGDYRIRGFSYGGTLMLSAAYLDNGGQIILYGNTHSTNAGNIYMRNRVGINTTTPITTLDVSGSARISQALTASLALISGSGSQRLTVQGSGSSILTVDGALGRLFSVDDAASGSLFSVNTISGLPIMEAFSDNTVRIGQFGQRALFVSQSRVGIGKEDNLNATLDVSGSMALTGSFNHQGNYTTTGVITAQTLVISTISSSVVYSSGSNVFGNSLSNTQVLTGSVSITGSLNTVGDVVIRGSGNTSATYALTTLNSSNASLLSIRNDGLGTIFGNFQIFSQFPYVQLGPSAWGSSFYLQSGVNLAANAAGDYTLIANPANRGFAFLQGSTQSMVIAPTTNNLLLGTTSDDTVNRLQVSGSSRFIGDMVITGSSTFNGSITLSGNISSTSFGGSIQAGNTFTFYSSNGNINAVSNLNISLTGNASGVGLSRTGNTTLTSGNSNFLAINTSGVAFAPTSGTATMSGIVVSLIVSQSGDANGITRGLHITPTLTSAWDYRSIEWTNNASATSGSWGLYGSGSAPNYLSGSLGIGTTAIGSNALVVNGNANFGGTNGLTWDSVNNRLGIGTNTPSARLEISSSATFATGITLNNSGSIGYIWGDGSSMNMRAGGTHGIQISGGSASILPTTVTTGQFRIDLQLLTSLPIYTYFGDPNTGIGRSAEDVLTFFAGGERARLSGGNLLLGTTTDDTFNRLQVSGSSRFIGDMVITGSGATSATIGLTVANSSGTNLLRVRNDGALLFSAGSDLQIYSQQNSVRSSNLGSGFTFQSSVGSGVNGPDFRFFNDFVSSQITSGERQGILVNGMAFFPSSGTGTFTTLDLKPWIAQTGGANGITRGLYVNPTLTSNADFRAIEWSNNLSGSTSWGLYGAGTAPNLLNGRLTVNSSITASQALISGSGTQRLTVVGSGSAQPLFTVQGSQGELFSIVDSLSGSLFSVNDQSGLPIMEVFSDNTTLVGNYLAPMLLTTTKTGSAAGINTIYSLPTSSYDAVYIDYTIRSGSNARAGNFMAMWSGTSVNFTDNSITEFGSTSAFTFGAHISGANMVVTGSAPTAGWTIKTIIKAI